MYRETLLERLLFNLKQKASLEALRDEAFLRKKGRKELFALLNGERLTPKQAILAKCCHCQLGYKFEEDKCWDHRCPLYPFTPYPGVITKSE
jgi:hypothetical protein